MDPSTKVTGQYPQLPSDDQQRQMRRDAKGRFAEVTRHAGANSSQARNLRRPSDAAQDHAGGVDDAQSANDLDAVEGK